MSHKKIRVGLVTSVIDGRRASGTALVARKFLEQLDRFTDEFDFTLIHYQKDDDPIYKKFPELLIPAVRVPFANHFFREVAFWITQRIRGNRFDIVHHLSARVWPSYLLSSSKQVVVTPYEAGVMLNFYKPGPADYVFRFTNRFLHQRMHGIVVCSEDSKREIVEYFHTAAHRVFVVPLGVDPAFQPITVTNENEKKLRDAYGIVRPYNLCVARFDPHKNIVRLIEAYALFRKAGGTERLVLVGGRHMKDYSEKVDEKIRNLGLTESVHIAPYIPDEDMPLLYSAAEAFVFPSLHEGWGMPIIEAFACGTPTATSNTSACPEAAGNAAILFDPENPEDIAKAMERLVSDKELRQTLRERGLKRAHTFTWEKTADTIVALYRDLRA